VSGLDELGARAVGKRTLRTAVTQLRALRTARSFRGTRGTSSTTAAITARPPDGPRLAGSHYSVQAEPVRTGLGVPDQQRLQDWRRMQTVPVRGRVQGGRGVALSRDGRLVRPHTHVQRPKGLRKDLPVHQERHRKVSTSALLADTVLLAGRKADR